MKKTETPFDKLTLEKIHSSFVLFLFAFLCLCISILLLYNQNIFQTQEYSLRIYIGMGFFYFFVMAFLYLLMDIFLYYLSKTWTELKPHFKRYKKYYYLLLAFIPYIISAGIVFLKFGLESLITLLISSVPAALLGVPGWVFVAHFLKKNKKTRKKKKP